MKTVLLVNVSTCYISNETCYPVNLTYEEKLLNNFHPKCTFIELYTPLIKFNGKTYKELDEKINEYSKTNSHDFLSIIIKK